MKSLKEFIAENLESPTITTVQNNSEQTNENQISTDKINENNENIIQGLPNTEKYSKEA